MHAVDAPRDDQPSRFFRARRACGATLALAVVLLGLAGCGRKAERPAARPPSAAAAPTPAAPAPVQGPAERIESIDSIGERGSKGMPELDTLIAALDDESADVRWHAARSIGLVGKTATSAIPRLLSKLADADPVVVTQAVAAIGRIRADDPREASGLDPAERAAYESAVPPLVGCIVHADPRVRRAALRSLEQIHADRGKVVDLANDLLADEDPSVVVPALQSLADMGESAVPFLVESLDHPKARYWAMLALAEIGPAAAGATPKLLAFASQAEPEERLQAIMALAAVGEPASEAADMLVEMVSSADAGDRMLHPAAIYALGRIRAKKGFAPLAAFLASDDPVLAAAAAWARARIEPDDPKVVGEAVERLRRGLANPDAIIRKGAVSAITDLADEIPGAAAAEVADDLVGLLSDDQPDVRRSAAVALAKIGKPSVGPVTSAFSDPKRRAVAAEVLAEMGPAAADAIPTLVGALGDDDPIVRSDAAFAIASIGAEADEAVVPLVKLLDDHPGGRPGDEKDPARGASYTAAYALGKIGGPAREAVDKIHALVDSDDPLLATVAAWAGLKIEPERKELYTKAIPLLTRALAAENDLARLEAASALGDIGPAASNAVPVLEMVAEDDPVAAVREAAAEALRHIGGR